MFHRPAYLDLLRQPGHLLPAVLAKALRPRPPTTVSAWAEANMRLSSKQAVRAGLDGQPTFHAKENGHEVGTPIPYDPAKASSLAALIAAGLFVPGKATEKPKGSRRG